MGSTLVGRLLGAFIDDPTRYGLDFAFTATFLALLLGMWKGRSDLDPLDRRGAGRHRRLAADRGQLVHHRRRPRGSFAGALAETMRKGTADVA